MGASAWLGGGHYSTIGTLLAAAIVVRPHLSVTLGRCNAQKHIFIRGTHQRECCAHLSSLTHFCFMRSGLLEQDVPRERPPSSNWNWCNSLSCWYQLVNRLLSEAHTPDCMINNWKCPLPFGHIHKYHYVLLGVERKYLQTEKFIKKH